MKRILSVLTIATFLVGFMATQVHGQAERVAGNTKINSWTGGMITEVPCAFAAAAGKRFYLTGRSGLLGDGDTTMVTVEIPDSLNGEPNTTYTWALWAMSTTNGAGYLDLYEIEHDTGSVATGGTIIQPQNQNRATNQADTSHSIWRLTPDIGGYGTLIWTAVVGGGNKIGGGGGCVNKWILKPGFTYIFRFESDNAGNQISHEIQFAESAPMILNN